MASVKKHGKKWQVRWRELRVRVDKTGKETRYWGNGKKICPTKRSAQELKRAIEEAHARGEQWQPANEQPIVTLHVIAFSYIKAAVDMGAKEATQLFRSSMIGSFLNYAGEEELASSLTLTLLGQYAASLPSKGRKATTRHRKILEVERMWDWAFQRPEQFPGVPPPRRLTGQGADRIQAPPPVIALASPTWADIDAMIACLDKRPWHRHAAMVQRYHGLRVGQVLALHWSDVDLDRQVLLLRAGVRGAKTGAARVVPLHPALAEEMASWGAREGLVFSRPNGGAWRTDTLRGPFQRAWENSGVSTEKWGKPKEREGLSGERAHGRPTHALRAAFQTELTRAGVPRAICQYLVGHKEGATIAAYVSTASPEESPYWDQAVEAIAKIPRVVLPEKTAHLNAPETT